MTFNVDVSIIAPKPDPPDPWIRGELPDADIRVFKNYGSGAFFAAPGLHDWLRRHGSAFDVVHVHGLLNPVSSLAARTCVKKNWPMAIRPFGTMSRYTFTHRRQAIKRVYSVLLDRSNLRSAGAVHFTTDEERQESEWQGVQWDNRDFVIPPPWIPGESTQPRTRRGRRRKVLVMSRLHPVKHIELLLDSWSTVLSHIPDAQLNIAGGGDPLYVRELRDRANGLSSSISFLGHLDASEKQAALNEADLFVHPSRHENFGMAVFEAISAGLPVVVTPEVQLSRFIQEHSLGVICERTPDSLANSIICALRNDVLSDRSRIRGAQLLSELFSLTSIGGQLLEMYRFAIKHLQNRVDS